MKRLEFTQTLVVDQIQRKKESLKIEHEWLLRRLSDTQSSTEYGVIAERALECKEMAHEICILERQLELLNEIANCENSAVYIIDDATTVRRLS